MKRTITYVCILAGLASCSDEEGGGIPRTGREIGFSGAVSRAAAGDTPGEEVYDIMTDNPDYGTVYIHHTRNGSFTYKDPQYHDADSDLLAYKANAGRLDPVKDGGSPAEDCLWYWDGSDTQHVFHAWTLPKDSAEGGGLAEGEAVAGLDPGSDRYGWVSLSMNKRYEGGKRLSNLEYFIGAVKGPVSLRDGSTSVLLDFRHLVAKIIVEDIQYVRADGSMTTLNDSDDVFFSMPNMPNRAYWTTGVPAKSESDSFDLQKAGKQEPRLLALDLKDEELEGIPEADTINGEKDYGVSGTLNRGWCFYIYPCTFASRNTLDNELGEIEFKYKNNWYYGTLASLTHLKKLEAGQCIALTLLLKDGDVDGLYPHITEWSTTEGEAPQHDHPGIYDEADWKKYIDWMKECEEAEKAGQTPPEPPAGLFDENGDLNIYGNLDLRSMGNDYSSPDKLRFPEGGGKLKGNGHRVKTDSDWSNLQDSLEDIWISENGENTRYD